MEYLSMTKWVFPGCALLVSFILTPVIIAFASRYGIFDQPGFRKVHARPLPRLGGIAIFLGFWTAFGLYFWSTPSAFPYEAQEPLKYVFMGSLAVWLLGLYDDFFGCSAIQKLLVQSLAAICVIYGGLDIHILLNPFGNDAFLLSQGLNVLITFCWLLFVSNAINLIDGLDGLAGGVCLITSLTIAVISKKLGNPYLPVVGVCLAASCLGFLFFNFAPARIFLGDSGSLFLGFILACLSIVGSTKRSTAIVMFGPPIILALPVVDALLAIMRRFLRRASTGHIESYKEKWSLHSLWGRFKEIFNADQEHIHHALLKFGLSHRRAVIILYGVTAILGLTAYQMAVKEHLASTLIVFSLLALILLWVRRKAFPNDKNRLKLDL